MTIPAPSVEPVYNYLLTAIPAQFPSDSGIGMYLGDPGDEPEMQFIQLLDARMAWNPETFVGSGGEFFLMESYTIDVKVSAAGAIANFTTDPLAILAQAWQLVDYVTTAVRSDLTLGGLVTLAYPQAAVGGSPTACNVGRESTLTVPIYVELPN